MRMTAGIPAESWLIPRDKCLESQSWKLQEKQGIVAGCIRHLTNNEWQLIIRTIDKRCTMSCDFTHTSRGSNSSARRSKSAIDSLTEASSPKSYPVHARNWRGRHGGKTVFVCSFVHSKPKKHSSQLWLFDGSGFQNGHGQSYNVQQFMGSNLRVRFLGVC